MSAAIEAHNTGGPRAGVGLRRPEMAVECRAYDNLRPSLAGHGLNAGFIASISTLVEIRANP